MGDLEALIRIFQVDLYGTTIYYLSLHAEGICDTAPLP